MSILGTITSVCLGTLSGYAFARLRVPVANFFFFLILSMMFIPIYIYLIPLFVQMKQLHLTNNLWNLVIVYTFFNLPTSTYVMRSFFLSIHHELEEQALIDGASQWQVFAKIMAPLVARRLQLHLHHRLPSLLGGVSLGLGLQSPDGGQDVAGGAVHVHHLDERFLVVSDGRPIPGHHSLGPDLCRFPEILRARVDRGRDEENSSRCGLFTTTLSLMASLSMEVHLRMEIKSRREWRARPRPRHDIGRQENWAAPSWPEEAVTYLPVPGLWQTSRPELKGAVWYERAFSHPGRLSSRRARRNQGRREQLPGRRLAERDPPGPARRRVYAVLFRARRSAPTRAENRLVLRVADVTDDTTEFDGLLAKQIPGGKERWYYQASGIWQSVTLRSTGPAWFDSVRLLPDLDRAELVWRAAIGAIRRSRKRCSWSKSSTPRDARIAASRRESLRLPAGSMAIEGKFSLPACDAWSPADPVPLHRPAAPGGKRRTPGGADGLPPFHHDRRPVPPERPGNGAQGGPPAAQLPGHPALSAGPRLGPPGIDRGQGSRVQP